MHFYDYFVELNDFKEILVNVLLSYCWIFRFSKLKDFSSFIRTEDKFQMKNLIASRPLIKYALNKIRTF